MANNSASSTENTTSKTSRFSTLNVFKFSTKGKETDGKPPPPPPKDLYYLHKNKSLASLSPDSLSIPPRSPNLQTSYHLSPDMNNSSMSLVSSAASSRSSTPNDSSKPRKGRGIFKFARRSPKSPPEKTPPSSDEMPPPPVEDDNISLPFNFQHNIHVDEGFTGLPPSWSTSLVKAGFSDAEIADIQRRRAMAARSLAQNQYYTDRPASPAYSLSSLTVPPPVITNPSPRTTSLSRQYSDASIGKSPPFLPIPASSPPSLTTSPPTMHTPLNGAQMLPTRRQYSVDNTPGHHPSLSSASISASADSHHSSSDGYGLTKVPSAAGNVATLPPSTPPRRTYHVANDPSTINSPPPSYSHFPSNSPDTHPIDRKDPRTFEDTPSALRSQTPSGHAPTSSVASNTPRDKREHTTRNADTTDDASSSHSTPSTSHSTSVNNGTPTKSGSRPGAGYKRSMALPPRLSLHKSGDSTDLSKWGEALLSGISTPSASITPNSSTFAAAQEEKLTGPGGGGSSGPSGSIPSNTIYYAAMERARSGSQSSSSSQASLQSSKLEQERQLHLTPSMRSVPPLVPRKPKPANIEPVNADDEGGSPSSALAEPSRTARYSPVVSTPSDGSTSLLSALEDMVRPDPVGDQQIYSAALNESSSPTIPITPNSESRRDTIKPHDFGYEDQRLNPNMLDARGLSDRSNRDSSRSSTSTVTGLSEVHTIVRNVSIARRTGAYVIDNTKSGKSKRRTKGQNDEAHKSPSSPRHPVSSDARPPASPLSSNFGSEEDSASGSNSSSSLSQDHQTPTTEVETESPLTYYLDGTPSPDPSKVVFSPGINRHLVNDMFNATAKENAVARLPGLEDLHDADEDLTEGADATHRPTIVINGSPPSSPHTVPVSGATPLSPYQQYRGWLSEVVSPLEEFIDEAVDPRDHYLDLQEIAEGESGSVYAARLSPNNMQRLRLPPLVKAQDRDDLTKGRTTLVAIKCVAIMPSGSPKLVELEKELTLLKGKSHEHVLTMNALYVDLVEDTLWIRMELMERSLADIIGLVEHGLILQERVIARFASDILEALAYLQMESIAHRDVRSDNLLINSKGVLKLTDFSTAIQVSSASPSRSDAVGVIYWQAPEMRSPPYDPLKVDVWSLGATVWELAQAEPPFAETQLLDDRWPPLRKPELYAPGFHDFLRQCSRPSATRPSPNVLKKTQFINNACGRPVIVQLLSQCMAIEKALQEADNS